MAVLHRTRTLPALMPRYVERFQCLGPSCEDTCCAGWPIHIDKKTYKAYRQDGAQEPVRSLSKSLVRFDHGAGNGNYAMIRTEGQEQRCPAMADGLCSVHKTLGDTHLSDVCHSYPRVTQQFGGQVEQVLTLSCPQAARLALLAEDAFEFTEGSVTLREATIARFDGHPDLAPALMNDVRIFCLNLMRTRELALWQRLALLGVFCESLSKHMGSGRQAGIPALLERFIGLVEAGELQASLDQVQPNHGAQAMVFATLWGAKGFAAPSPYQQALIGRISAGLGADENGQTEAAALVAAYTAGLARLDQVLADAPFLLENYLLNEMFVQVFPFAAADVYDNYLHLVARFGLLRLLLAARCNAPADVSADLHEDALGVQALAAIVQLHCRRFQHDSSYTRQIHFSLHDSGWASLDKLYSLLRT